MDLQQPLIKMSKSNPNGAGVLYLLDPPDVLRRKIKRAVTDSLPGISYDPDRRPGLANLLEVGAACADVPVEELVGRHQRFGSLKEEVADAVISVLQPLQRRYAEVGAEELSAAFDTGAQKAGAVAARTLQAARTAIGL
jgi:tryptophanyl-tRNA synthetase